MIPTNRTSPEPDLATVAAAPEAVVIGASAGAVEALTAILPALPRDYPLPVMVVVHLPPDRESILAEIFRAKCRVEVKEVEDKEPIEGATVYFAAPDYHMLVEPNRRLSLSVDDPVLYSRPSVDVLFQSAAAAYGPALVGVVLSGASSDGAEGLKSVCDAGGTALVQRPDTAQAFAMPAAALDACAGAAALSVDEIATFLREAPRTRSH